MNKSGTSEQVISLPEGGGAQKGLGETFSPDLHTGTGNFSVPIALPAGRNGFQPELTIVYSTGNGNSCLGLGWQLSIPGVSRKTSKGIPRYFDGEPNKPQDTFLLSGAEDLVPVAKGENWVQYRPRTEGLFAIIRRYLDVQNDYWEVKSKDCLVSWYGTPGMRGDDPAVVFNPDAPDPTRIFCWKLSETRDPFGNQILYEYLPGLTTTDNRRWNELYLQSIRYLDYEDENGETRFLVSVEFEYEDERPDAFSVYTSGFEMRTTKRCTRIATYTHPGGQPTLVRSYDLVYENESFSRVSLLKTVQLTGHDGDQTETLPPLTFGYTTFEPTGKNFLPVGGKEFPLHSLGNPDTDLIDLDGNGLPDIVQMNGVARYWKNLGNGQFDLPRTMRNAPAGVRLGDPNVRFMDANGEGRADLVVHNNGMSGYFPTTFEGEWDRRSFRKHKLAPTFNFQDPEVRLVDLNGDGITDLLRSGSRMECYFNDPEQGWNDLIAVERKALDVFPDVNLSDPRVRLADMSGDGLQDLVLIHDGKVEYWSNMGYGRWGKRIQMRNSPRFPLNYDPKRILLGDIAGDGPHDIIYVDNRKVTIWINQNGNAFSDPIEIGGTPPVTDMDAVRLEDLLGTGTSGILWSADQRTTGREHYFFLDLTGGVKPFVLDEMNNHTGAITKVEYKPSTYFYQQDAKDRNTRWKTPLPFPVQVVACVEVIDEISRNKLTTEYRYHHGYWDGAEREFRGFGRVEQVDTQAFYDYSTPGLHGEAPFQEVAEKFYTPPTLTKTWFYQGPVGEGEGYWETLDYYDEYWSGDPQLFNQTASIHDSTKHLPRRAKRDYCRVLRGSVLRTELYALDGNTERESRPYTVTESYYMVRQEFNPEDAPFAEIPKGTSGYIFLPLANIARTTQWERGDDPMTQLSFAADWDAFGNAQVQIAIACPRGCREMGERFGEATPFLSTYSKTQLAYSNSETPYIKGRAAKTSAFEILHRGEQTAWDIVVAAMNDPDRRELLSQSLTYYDGPAFEGLPFGQIGQYGVPVRSESIIIDEKRLREACKSGNTVGDPPELPPYLMPGGPPDWTTEYPQAFRDVLPPLAGYTFHDGSGAQARGYWAQSSSKFDFQEPGLPAKGLPLVQRDALQRETAIQYDAYHFLPVRVTDPLGLTISAEYDYRLFQAKLSTDPNDNVSMLRFSPLGFVKETYLIGKEGVAEGDALDRNDPNALPGARYEYDFHAFEQSGQPIFVKTIAREHHRYETDVPDEQRGDTITTIEFSDGFGRFVQTRVQAEDLLFGDEHFGTGLLPPDPDGAVPPGATVGKMRQPDDPENVVVSGWKIYNNKGLVVQQYEPYYDKGFDYSTPEDYQFGKKSEMFYDPRGQVIRTLNPDGSEQRVIYGIPIGPMTNNDPNDLNDFIPTPWEAYTYDANDLAPLCTGPDGNPLNNRAQEEHHFTPASIEIDSLGRTVKAVARQRNLRQQPEAPLPPLEEFVTRSTYDIRGNLLTVTDALNREAFIYTYDLTYDKENGSRVWRIESIDAGLRRIVFHALGMEIERRDSKGSLTLQAHDRGNRLTHLWARNHPGEPATLRQHLLYGDTTPQPPPDGGGVLAGNFKGKLLRHYDEAGLVEVHGYDFKGNPLASSRRTIRNEAVRPFLGSVEYTPFIVDWERPDAEAFYLETKTYRGDSAFDALNRPKRITYPEDVSGERKVLLPAYNRAGALESISLLPGSQGTEIAGVKHLAYNAKGQRTLVAYANGLMTRYEYEPDTFRLARLRTEKYQRPDTATFQPNGGLLQDLAYTYDLGGNITRIRDRGTGKGINGVYPFERDFGYDAIYRLVYATGIEHSAYTHADEPWLELMQHHNDDLTQARGYRQQYSYDPMGNMLELRHRNLLNNQGGAGQYTRSFQTLTENNRLRTMEQGGNTYTYAYDPNGNMTREATNRRYHWNHADQLTRYSNQPEGSTPTVDACYLYDAERRRVKKIVLKGGGLLRTTTYIGDAFEYHTQGDAANNTLHVMDDQSRIALLRVGTPLDANDDSPAVQYQLGDHLGNVQFVVDGYGGFYNREEQYPYGGTSFGGFSKKRYRFTGKERDEESGLSYHAARYYAGWLGKWVSADPIGMEGGYNAYVYASNSSINLFDLTGNSPKDPPATGLWEWMKRRSRAWVLGGRILLADKSETARHESTRDTPGDQASSASEESSKKTQPTKKSGGGTPPPNETGTKGGGSEGGGSKGGGSKGGGSKGGGSDGGGPKGGGGGPKGGGGKGPGAATAFEVGWMIGTELDKQTGWSVALASRADKNQAAYEKAGLNETAATVLAVPSTIPVASDIGEGIGWGLAELVPDGHVAEGMTLEEVSCDDGVCEGVWTGSFEDSYEDLGYCPVSDTCEVRTYARWIPFVHKDY